jgi:hypothetical protein
VTVNSLGSLSAGQSRVGGGASPETGPYCTDRVDPRVAGEPTSLIKLNGDALEFMLARVR